MRTRFYFNYNQCPAFHTERQGHIQLAHIPQRKVCAEDCNISALYWLPKLHNMSIKYCRISIHNTCLTIKLKSFIYFLRKAMKYK